MKYAIYFQWDDGTKWGAADSDNVDNARERDLYIKTLKSQEDILGIAYCPIYKSGEYGQLTIVKEEKKY